MCRQFALWLVAGLVIFSLVLGLLLLTGCDGGDGGTYDPPPPPPPTISPYDEQLQRDYDAFSRDMNSANSTQEAETKAWVDSQQ